MWNRSEQKGLIKGNKVILTRRLKRRGYNLSFGDRTDWKERLLHVSDIKLDGMHKVLCTALHFPAHIWLRFLLGRLQAVIHLYTLHRSALIHTSEWILCISLVAEATVQTMNFNSLPGFDGTRLLSTSVLSLSRLIEVCKDFIRHSWFTDFIWSR